MRKGVCLLLLSLSVLATAQGYGHGRSLLESSAGSGRRLLDVTANATQSFSLIAFGTSAGTPGGNCYIQGYPGSRADSVVAGPLTVDVPSSSPITISFSPATNTYFQNYNYSGSINQTSLSQNSSFGLINVMFSPTAVGQSVNIFSGLIEGSNPITQPTCLVNITFVAVAPPPPPPPPPVAGCGGSSSVPCYCQNGYCFSNGATLSTACTPPGGQSCTPATVNPASIGIQYATGYPSTVTVCQCTATSG